MSGEFVARKDSHPSKFEWRAQILVKLGFKELCDSKWSELHTFDNTVIFLSSETNPWINFSDPHWELICCKKWHPETSWISISLEIAVEVHFHVGHGTKTISVFLPVDGKTSWLLLSSLLSLISGCTVQPENTHFSHSLWRGKYHPLFPINKPTLPPLWFSPPSLKTADRKTP